MRICKVTWLDATGGLRTGWRSLKSIHTALEESTSVGFLLRDDDVVVIVPHLSGIDEGDGEIAIPRTCVKEVVDLVPARKKSPRQT